MKNTLLYASAITLLVSCASPEKQPENKEQKENERYDLELKDKLDVFSAIGGNAEWAENSLTPEKIKLGHFLYYDKRLSKDGNISCNSCHNLSAFGVDNLPVSPGDAGKTGERNSPTVLNAALHSKQFWDGRAENVEQQAGMPILNPIEMAIPSEDFLVKRLAGIDTYKQLFKEAYPNEKNPINYKNLRLAIAAFERTLITPSRFDNYLQGDMSALTVDEKKGLLTFVLTNCPSCHNGELLGGKSIQKFGVYANYWDHTGSKSIDKGVAANTKDTLDNYRFKTPSLRNIEKTFPYFHDGSVNDLDAAVKIMGKTQLNVDLTQEQVNKISTFLKSLTADVPDWAKKDPHQ